MENGYDPSPTGLPLQAYLVRLIWVCVLPLLLLAAWLAYDSVREQQSNRRESAAHLARNFATGIDQDLRARMGALNLLAVSPLVDDPSRWRELYTEALGFKDSFGSNVILASVGEPMRMLFNTRLPFGSPMPPLPRPSGHAAAPAAVASGRPAVGDTFFGPIAKEPLVAVAVPAMRSGQAAFLLLTIFEASAFQRQVDRAALPEGWMLTLLDGSGRVIARRASADTGPDMQGAERFVVRSEVSPWSVVLEIPRTAYRAPLLGAALSLAFGLAAATLIGVLGGMLASRRLGRAVAVLAAPADKPAPAGSVEISEFSAARRRLEEAAASRDRAEAALRDHAAQLATLSRRLLRLQEDERRTLAAELHDEFGQTLTAIKLNLAALRRGVAAASLPAVIDDTIAMVEDTIHRIRDRSLDLRPPALDDIGLAGAVESYLGRIATTAGCTISANIAPLTERPAPEVETAAFRIVQEALTNAIRHAGARCVEVRLWREDDQLCLMVADDGRGFETAAVQAGFGLGGMRERATLLGGEFMVDSSPGAGTRIHARLPN